jgi:hypothetical protein
MGQFAIGDKVIIRDNVFYATTTTAIGTAVKVVSGLEATYVPVKGDILNLYVTAGNNVTTPKLSINSVTYDLQFRDANLTVAANYTIPAKQLIQVIFNGTNWQFATNPDWSDDNTTYGVASTTTNGLMSKEDKAKIDKVSGNTYYTTTATAIGTAVKVVDGLATTYVPATGDVLNVYMSLGNNVTTPKLSINGTSYGLQLRGVDLTNTVNFTIPAKQTIQVVFDGTNFQFLTDADWVDNNDNTLTQLHLGNNFFQAGAAITKYHLAMEALDGKFYEICTGDTNAATKTASTQTFKLGGQILWYSGSATLAANGYLGTNAQTYWYYSNANVDYAFNKFAHCTGYRTVYLKGKVQSGGGFKLDATSATSWYTTELPTSEDGFVYIKLGAISANTATMFLLLNEHPIVEFRNGKIRPYSPYKFALSGSNLTITED